jgi:hypothetical protein
LFIDRLCWSIGVLEYWSVEKAITKTFGTYCDLEKYSFLLPPVGDGILDNTPSLQYSI